MALIGGIPGIQAQEEVGFLSKQSHLDYQGVTAESESSDILRLAYLPNDRQVLIDGDVIKFFVKEDEEPAQILQVLEDGTVDFPYIGHVDVYGRTPKHVAEFLKSELEKTYYYIATVYIGVERSNRVRGEVMVTGEVKHEGMLNIPTNKDFRLSNAILLAGGFTDMAKETKVLVVRILGDGRVTNIIIDTKPIFKEGKIEHDIILQDGDRIVVPKGIVRF